MSDNPALKKVLYIIVGSFVVGALIAVGSWKWWESAIAPVASSSSEPERKTIKIPEGYSATAVGQRLQKAGMIRSLLAWKIWLYHFRVRDKQPQLKAGYYELSQELSLPEIGKKLRQGNTIETRLNRTVTIPEGWTQQDIAEHFEKLGYFPAEEFIEATRNIDTDDYPWLPEDLPHLEGFLYPDTYHIPKEDVPPEMLIELKLERFEQVAIPLYRKNDTPYTLQEWVTLASIVEQEALVDHEYTIIAAVFAKRLEEDMPLAADPTVEYAFNIEQTEHRPLTIEEVNKPSPYNTYIKEGLPPTPISSPGKQALKASLNPPETDYRFFLARYDGTHVFSKTYEQHRRAKRRLH